MVMGGSWTQAMALYAISRRNWGGSSGAGRRQTAARPATQSRIVALARAANAGDAEAQYSLGVLGLVGKLGSTGRKKAHALLAAAAMQNHAGACFVLGMLHQHGVLVPRSLTKAAHLFQKAARSGHARSQNALAHLMLAGHGIARNTTRALALFEAAAARGLPEAKANLGVLYLHGYGIADCEYGLALVREAADDGLAVAQHYLAWLYHAGIRLPQDLDAACMWYARAAESGHAKSQYQLALLLLQPDDDRLDLVTALKWLLVLAAGDDRTFKEPAGRIIDKLAPGMAPADVACATDAAMQWLRQQKAVWTPIRVRG